MPAVTIQSAKISAINGQKFPSIDGQYKAVITHRTRYIFKT